MKIQTMYGYMLKFASATMIASAGIVAAYASVVEPPYDVDSLHDGSSSPAFSAIYRYSHQPSETMLDSARVQVSEAGLRIDQLIEDSGNGLIANFETNQLWFLDSQRELVHQVPVIAVDPVDKQSAEQVAGLLPGFIQFTPCRGMRAIFSENVVLHGHILSRWQCQHDSGEQVQEQLFSTRLGVVLWSQDVNGFTSELVDVRLSEPNPGIFRPPSHYREVDLRELIQGSSLIDAYQEADSDLQ